MPDSEKRTLYGEALVAENDIAHLSHIYTPHKKDAYVISKEDFVDNSFTVYGSKLPIFKEFSIKKGAVIGAIFKEKEEDLQEGAFECKLQCDETEDLEKNAHSFTKSYTLENKTEESSEDPSDEKIDANPIIVDGKYEYQSLSYESPYVEIIQASYDDERGRLDISLKTQDAVLTAKVIAECLSLDEKDVRVSTIAYTSSYDEFFLSTLYAAVIAAKAAEKFGANIRYMYRPYSISPSFSICRRTELDRMSLSVKSETVEINSDCGNALMLEEEIAELLFVSSLPFYKVESTSVKVNLLSSNNRSTFFFLSYFKAVALSSSLEHLYRLAFATGKEPMLFLEEHLADDFEDRKEFLNVENYRDLQKAYKELLKAEDAYVQSAIFEINDEREGVFLSSISALNKAQSSAVFLLTSGLPMSFAEKNDFAFGASKDADTANSKLYLGTSTSIENKARLDDAIETLENNTNGQNYALTLRGVPRDKNFTVGPDVMRRHTSIALSAIKNAIINKKIHKDFSIFPLSKSADIEANTFWGTAVMNGYKDFVTDEIVITSIHLSLLHSSLFRKEEDVSFYRQAVLRSISLLNIRLSNDFEDKDDFKIDLIDTQLCIDAIEGVFPLVLSAFRLLSFLLSPHRKLLKDASINKAITEEARVSSDDENKEVKNEA